MDQATDNLSDTNLEIQLLNSHFLLALLWQLNDAFLYKFEHQVFIHE